MYKSIQLFCYSKNDNNKVLIFNLCMNVWGESIRKIKTNSY